MTLSTLIQFFPRSGQRPRHQSVRRPRRAPTISATAARSQIARRQAKTRHARPRHPHDMTTQIPTPPPPSRIAKTIHRRAHRPDRSRQIAARQMRAAPKDQSDQGHNCTGFDRGIRQTASAQRQRVCRPPDTSRRSKGARHKRHTQGIK